jgi:hypothetical protein
VIHSGRSLKELIQQEVLAALESDHLDRKTYDLLSELPPLDFVTTNWDTLLEDSFKPTSVRTIFLDDEVFFWNPDRRNILKIHGCVRCPSSMVVTRREYEGYQEAHPHFVRKLLSLFTERTLIVCGYSLEDTDFREIYRKAAVDIRLTGDRIFWVDPYARETYIEEWNDLGVRFVPATARDFFESLIRELTGEGNAHSALDGSPVEDLFRTARRLRELERTFSVLEDEEISDYDFFREKITRTRILLDQYASEAGALVPNLDPRQLDKLKKQNSFVRALPVRIGNAIQKNKANLAVPNPQSIAILLKDLVENSAAPLAGVEKAIYRREEMLSGRPFASVEKAGPVDEFKEALLSLSKKTGLAEFSEFLALLAERSGEIADYLSYAGAEDELRSATLARLWQHLDIVIVKGLRKNNFPFSDLYDRARIV